MDISSQLSRYLATASVRHIVIAADKMSDQALADTIGYLVTCYKAMTPESFSHSMNNALLPHMENVYEANEYEREIWRTVTKGGIVYAAQEEVAGTSDIGFKALAQALNELGGSWHTDEVVESYLKHLAWCFRCFSVDGFVASYPTEHGDEAAKIAAGITKGSTSGNSTCHLIEVAASLVDNRDAFMRLVHAFNHK